VDLYQLGTEPQSFALFSTDQRCLVFDTELMDTKAARDTIGINVINLKKGQLVERTAIATPGSKKYETYRVFSLPRAGMPLKHEQLGL